MSGPGRTPGRRTRATPAPEADAHETSSFGPRRSLSPARSPTHNTRQRGSPTKSELPALTPRLSRAFGSAARPSLSQDRSPSTNRDNPFDVAAASNAANLARSQVLPAQDSPPARPRRGRESTAVATDMAPPKIAPAKRGPGRPKKALQPIEEDGTPGANADDEDDEEEEDSRPDELAALSHRRQLSPVRRNARAVSTEGTTVMENSNNYFPAAAVAQGVQRRSRTASPDRQRPVIPIYARPAGPSRLQVLATTVYNFLAATYRQVRDALRQINFVWLFYFSLPTLLSVAAWCGSPYVLQAYNTLRPVETVKDYGNSAVTSLSNFSNPFSNITWGPAIDLKTSARIKELENRLDYLNSRNELSQSAIAKLQQMLPERTLVEFKDGQYDVPDLFIRALHTRIHRELGLASTLIQSDDKWEEFAKVNDVRIKNAFDTLANNAISRAFSHRVVFTADDVETYIRKCHDSIGRVYIDPLREQLEQRMSQWKNTTDISTIARVEQVLSDRLSVLPEVQLAVLTEAILLRNAHEALKSVNHFSAMLGAILIPSLTSPTYDSWKGNMTPSRWFFWYLSPFWGEYRSLQTATSALEPWFEAGNCWCGAPPVKKPQEAGSGLTTTKSPVLQIGILIQREVYPEKITIEHAPAEAVYDIRSAPRTMELWVSIKNETVRDQVYNASQEIFAARGAQEYPPASTRKDGISLDASYVRIGRWLYDPRLSNHVQTFPLQVLLEDFGVGVQRLVVRSLTNWGEEYTCLYRVRLHGEPVEPRKKIVVGKEFEGVYYDEEK